jgi:hypothetical protein
VQLDAEARLYCVETLWRRHFGPAGLEFDDEGEDLGRDLVTAFGAALPGQQTRKPGNFERALGFVESRPREPKSLGDFADADAIHLVAPHHLVTDLEQVVRIEKWIAYEKNVADGFGMRIECAIPRERFLLWVLPYRLCHARP